MTSLNTLKAVIDTVDTSQPPEAQAVQAPPHPNNLEPALLNEGHPPQVHGNCQQPGEIMHDHANSSEDIFSGAASAGVATQKQPSLEQAIYASMQVPNQE